MLERGRVSNARVGVGGELGVLRDVGTAHLHAVVSTDLDHGAVADEVLGHGARARRTPEPAQVGAVRRQRAAKEG